MSELMDRPPVDAGSVGPPGPSDAGEDFEPARVPWRRVVLWGTLGLVLLAGIVLAVAVGPFADAAGSCGGG